MKEKTTKHKDDIKQAMIKKKLTISKIIKGWSCRVYLKDIHYNYTHVTWDS